MFPSVNKNEGFFNDNDRVYFKEMGIVNVSNSKKSLKENNYKVKYSEDELSMIMAEPDIFKLFKTDDYLE